MKIEHAQQRDFVRKLLMQDIVHGTGSKLLQSRCKYWGVDLEEFKKEHSEQIVFAILKR